MYSDQGDRTALVPRGKNTHQLNKIRSKTCPNNFKTRTKLVASRENVASSICEDRAITLAAEDHSNLKGQGRIEDSEPSVHEETEEATVSNERSE